MTVYGNYDVIAFKSCIQISTVYAPSCDLLIMTLPASVPNALRKKVQIT